MKDTLIGYASAMSGSYSVLKTTDGGSTWKNFSNGHLGTTPCVHATSKAIIKTKWSGDNGGTSVNNGQSYSSIFGTESNGIAFLDDLNGVVTMGPVGTANTYYTSDGGVTWRTGGRMRESWGVYADPITQTYYSMAEGDAGSPDNALWSSTDNGRTWQSKSYSNFTTRTHFTGHIAGVGKTMYVQTEDRYSDGLWRTDDAGITWRNVGGYSNERDSRFFVTGCRGEVVYAFDNGGGIYKTTDGGDGSLTASPYIASVPSAVAGGTVLIPVTYDTVLAATTVSEITGIIQLNDDLIVPDSLVFAKTQLDSITTFDTVYKTTSGWVFSIKIKNNKPLSGSSYLPLFYVSAHTYLTDTTESEVAIQTINFTISSKPTPLSTCTAQSAVFRLDLDCGDTTLIRALRGEKFVDLFALRPNPSDGNIRLSSSLPAASTIEASLITLGGISLRSETFEAPFGESEKTLDFHGVPPGEYILLLRSTRGTVRHLKVVIQR